MSGVRTGIATVSISGTLEDKIEAIAAAGYAVRHLPGQGLPQALRITIGTSAQMDEIAAVLRGLCGAQA